MTTKACRQVSLRNAIALGVAAFLLAACASNNKQAPVIERVPDGAKGDAGARLQMSREVDWRPKTYTVKKGDTLYSIGLEFGYDYKEIAEWNGLENANNILVGQTLRLQAPSEGENIGRPTEKKPPLINYPKAAKKAYNEQNAPANQNPGDPVKQEFSIAGKSPDSRLQASERKEQPASTDNDSVEWTWPATGKTIGLFNEGGTSKGLDIAGKSGEPVQASAAGKVVYSGSGLRGYGKLIIIKHNKSYLSAYAHNSQLLVREGEHVAKGQKIAEMGNTDANEVKLHFEIRRLGKPVDPLKFLPSDRTS